MRASRGRRLAVSALVGILAAFVCLLKERATPTHPADFALSWFGARSIIAGNNPYQLVGKGLTFDWPWPLVYPATSFVAAAPVSFLSRLSATIVFVFISFSLFTYAITKDGWQRLPAFGSMAVISAAAVGQWEPLLSASVAIAPVGFFLAAKPTVGIALALRGNRSTRLWAIAGAVVLGSISLLLFPAWPSVWLNQLHFGQVQMAPPLLRGGGFLILLALLRPSRDAWFLIAMSLVPQVGTWYTVVPLFLIPRTTNEAMILSGFTSLGWLLQDSLVTATSESALNAQVGSMLVAFAYLPCVFLLLHRSRESALSDNPLPAS